MQGRSCVPYDWDRAVLDGEPREVIDRLMVKVRCLHVLPGARAAREKASKLWFVICCRREGFQMWAGSPFLGPRRADSAAWS